MKLKSLLFSLLITFGASSFAQVLTFKVQTVTFNGTYGPDHVLAIWITNANGAFVKTIDKHAAARVQYLTNWIASTPAKNVTDATTGSTLTSHPSAAATYTWNCTDVNRAVVPDGSYYVNVEFTEGDFTGKYMKYPFTIGKAASATVTNVTTDPGKYISNVSWSTTQSTQTPIMEIQVSSKFSVCYKPNTKMVQVDFDPQLHEQVMLTVLDLKGRTLLKQSLSNASTVVNAAHLAKGAYVVKLTDSKGNTQSQKIVVR